MFDHNSILAIRVARSVCIVVGTVVFAIAVRVVLYHIPHTLYRIRRPVAAMDCSQVKAGMSLHEVQAIFDRDIPPRQLIFDSQNYRLAATREFATACVVEFDPSSKLVVRGYVENRGVGFPDL